VILYLVRHGETASNRDGLGLGRSDPALTPYGVLQAEAIAARLATEPLALVYSSPLSRAADVALAIAAQRGLAVEFTDTLLEMDVGDTEGMARDEARAAYPAFFEQWLAPAPETACMPGGESLTDVAVRVDAFLAALAGGPDDALAVVSHNFVLKVMLCRVLGLPLSAFRGIAVDLGSISTIMIRRERATVVSVNDTCHLPTLER
jgi:broad specificity phosphatase PhoE